MDPRIYRPAAEINGRPAFTARPRAAPRRERAARVAARGADLGHKLGGPEDVRHEEADQPPRVFGHEHAFVRKPGYFASRGLAPFRELSHLARHHCEALAGIPRPRRLDGRVQGEEIRLPRYFVDDAYARGDVLHRGDGAFHRGGALARIGRRLFANAFRGLGVVQDLPDGAGHLLHGGGHFFRARGLLGRALAHALGHVAQLLALRGDIVGRYLDGAHHRLQARVHRGKGPGQLACLILALEEAPLDAGAKIAVGYAFRVPDRGRERAGDRQGEENAEQHGAQGPDDYGDDHDQVVAGRGERESSFCQKRNMINGCFKGAEKRTGM